MIYLHILSHRKLHGALCCIASIVGHLASRPRQLLCCYQIVEAPVPRRAEANHAGHTASRRFPPSRCTISSNIIFVTKLKAGSSRIHPHTSIVQHSCVCYNGPQHPHLDHETPTGGDDGTFQTAQLLCSRRISPSVPGKTEECCQGNAVNIFNRLCINRAALNLSLFRR